VDRRVDLVIDPRRGDKVSISLPLRFRAAPEETRRALGLSHGIDLSDPIVARAVALLGAARAENPPIRVAVFGGVAFRLSCPASNVADGGMRHALHDLDLAILLKDSHAFQRFLSGVAEREGSALTFFETSGDKIYNSISGGRRLRWHAVMDQQGAEIVLGTVDVIADEFQFCHQVDVRVDVERASETGGTLSPAHLLLTKAQFIRKIPAEDAGVVADRVLEPFGKRQVVIGPEAKDVRDLLALLHDHPLGEGSGEISIRAIEGAAGSDWGLWKTLGLNLAMVARSAILKELRPDEQDRIAPRLAELRTRLQGLTPKRRFGFLGGPWWQEVDSTPSVDDTVSVG
jgi:hypothetical protein